MNRYFHVALAFAVVAVGSVVLYGVGAFPEPAARIGFGAGLLGTGITMIVAWTRKTSS